MCIHMLAWNRTRLSPLLAGVIVLACGGLSLADRYDDRYLDGLRERRLFQLAESFCERRLEGQLSEKEEFDLTLSLIRTYAAHAVNTPPEQRAPLWKSAHDAAAAFTAKHTDSPNRFVVQVQDALTTLARGELLRQVLEAGAQGAKSLDLALDQIRKAAGDLEDIDEELTREIPRRVGAKEGLTDAELFSLQNNVRYQLARAFRNRALCYETGANRLDALQQAVSTLNDVANRIDDADPLLWSIRLDQIVCLRLVGDYAATERLLRAVISTRPTPLYALRARAELVRLRLDTGKPEDAYAELQRGRTIAGMVSPEFDFAHLETYVALWKKAGEEEAQATAWRNKAKAMVAEIERTHGAYWRRRADRLLVSGASAGGDLDILARKADRLYLEGALQEAIDSYDQAGRAAIAAGAKEQAFLFLYRAGLIEQKREKYAAAAARLRFAAISTPEQPKASDAHLLAALAAAQQAATDPQELPAYIDLLEEHLTRWPEATSADQARIWLARMREHQRSWSEAMRLYLEVKPESTDYPSALSAAATAAQKYLDQLKSNGEPYEQQAENTALLFERLLLGDGKSLPPQWTPSLRAAALAGARIRLQHTSGGQARAASVLQDALTKSPDADPAWRNSAQALLVAALAAQPSRLAEAEKILRDLADGSPEDLLEMIAGLAAAAESASPAGQERLAQLQLRAIDIVSPKRKSLSPAAQKKLDTIRAVALFASNDRAQAKAAFQALIAAHPRDGDVAERFAEFLLAGADVASRQQALDQWRRVAKGSRPRTPRWWRAKYNTAKAMFLLNDKKAAADLIEYLQTTPPGLQGVELRPEFEKLLALCK